MKRYEKLCLCLVCSFRVQHIYVEPLLLFLKAMMSHDRNALRSGRHHCTWPFPIDIWIVLLGFACENFGLVEDVHWKFLLSE